MYLLHSIGDLEHPNYNSREQVAAHNDLSFDGVYKNVWSNRDLLIGKNVVLFIVGSVIGGDNTFDKGQPFEEFCNWEELYELQAMGAELAWHTWTHPDLTELSVCQIREEVTPPFPMKRFAYPYGAFNAQVERIVREAGFSEAFTVLDGNDSEYQQKRPYLPYHNRRLALDWWGGTKAPD